MTQDELKALVGQAALQYIQPGMLVGVGTGSTVNKFIDALAAVKDSIAGAVSSSVASTERLRALGIEVRFVDSNDPAAFAAAADDRTRAFFCESTSNPALEIADLEAIAASAHAIGLPLIVDSTFSTPYLTRPIDFGADIVVHSLTKWLGGHGAAIGGIVIDSGKFNWAGGRHPLFDQPDPSYHGLRWGHDLPAPLAPQRKTDSPGARSRSIPRRT